MPLVINSLGEDTHMQTHANTRKHIHTHTHTHTQTHTNTHTHTHTHMFVDRSNTKKQGARRPSIGARLVYKELGLINATKIRKQGACSILK